MWEDRRSQARYPCLITGEMRPSAGGFSDIVCTSISRGGAFLAGKTPPPAGGKLIVELRPYGADGPAIEASGEVAWSSPRGAATPPGCGIRWNSLRCSRGAEPLRAFAAEFLRWPDLGDLPVDSLGCAWLRLDGQGKLSGGFVAEMAKRSEESLPAAQVQATPPAEPAQAVALAQPVTLAQPVALAALSRPAQVAAAPALTASGEPLAEPVAAKTSGIAPVEAPLPAGPAAAWGALADAATEPERDLLGPALGWRGGFGGAPSLQLGGARLIPGQDEPTDPGVPEPAVSASAGRTPISLDAGPRSVAGPPRPPVPIHPADSGIFLAEGPVLPDAPSGAERSAAHASDDEARGRPGTNPGTGAVLAPIAPLSAVTAKMEAVDLAPWELGADPDLLLEELSGGITALAAPAREKPAEPAQPAPAAGHRTSDEQTFAYANSRDAMMAEIAKARAARAAQSGLVPLVPAGVRAASGGYAPAPAKAPAAHAGRVESSPGLPPQRRHEPAVALRHGPVQPVLQHWPAGVPRSLASRYRELQILGQGGHGVVYRARDAALDRYVVIKLLLQSTLGNDMARRYFQREVKLAASLNHPHIVHIYDVGEADGVLWYAMEYVDGVPLSQYMIPGKPLADLQFLYSVFSQLCEALDHAHSQGILHRDVKPDNVLVAADGTVKLFDFGLARGADQGFGEQSLLLGTPYYMAPEQLTGGKVTRATDAYALGVLLYRLLSGEVPFSKGNIFAAHVLEPVPDPRLLQPSLPEAAVAVAMRLLAKRPEDRYGDCRQAAADLWQACFGGTPL